MKTQSIIDKIYEDFAKTYKNAAPFVNSGALWDFCMETIRNPVTMSCIVFANDMGVPPVKSLINIYALRNHPASTFVFSGQESQFMGSLMGFVFKFVLGYKKQKDRCTVNEWGVKTAARFLDGPTVTFES